MAKFDLAAVLESAGAQLKSDGTERIEMIDIGLISADTRNFYQLTGIDELADNIRMCGLMDPIRVRDGAGGEYTVVSGHRRLEAIKQLGWESVPCIVEKQTDETIQELRIIMANANTRKLTDFEIAEQSRRLRSVLQELRDRGVEIPGRLRDIAADAMQVSASKIARLDKINKDLIDAFRTAWKVGMMPESVAYRLAQEPQEVQRYIYFCFGVSKLKQSSVEECEELIRRAEEAIEKPEEAAAAESETQSGKFDAGKQAEEIAEKYREARENLWQCLEDGLGDYLSERNIWGVLQFSERTDAIKNMGQNLSGGFGSPNFSCDFYGRKMRVGKTMCRHMNEYTPTELYDAYARWAITQLSKQSKKKGGVKINTDDIAWQTGTPPDGKLCFCKMDCNGTKIKSLLVWDAAEHCWKFENGSKVDAVCLGWYPLPEV